MENATRESNPAIDKDPIQGEEEIIQMVSCEGNPRGRGGTPYNGLYGEAPPERGTFFRLQVYKRVGISQVEVYKRVEKSVI